MALTPIQACILNAIDAGHTTTRAIADAIGMGSNSNIARHLHILAEEGLIQLEDCPHGVRVWAGIDYARGWDTAAELTRQALEVEPAIVRCFVREDT